MKIEQLRALSKAAPGEIDVRREDWEDGEIDYVLVATYEADGTVEVQAGRVRELRSYADLIAAARNHLDALLDVAEELRGIYGLPESARAALARLEAL